jgi:hypothetical protein
MSLLNESKRFDDFTPEEKRQIFNIFTQSYQKATGSSWDEGKFYSRASEWLFFGDPTGFVTVRPQKSGYYKLTGVAGNMKSILKALQELNTTHYPIWGMLTQELANILVRRYGFRMPNRVESFIIGKLISNNVFGNVEHKRNPDGSITFNYKDVGESTKVFVGNREYYKKARLDAVKRVFSPKQPVTEEVIDEKRAVEHHYEDSFKTLVAFISRFGYDKIYVSFRKTINTGFINRENAYDTPTGFYMYPIRSYQEKIAKVTNMKSFMQIFPFTPDSQFAFVFTLENNKNILFSSNPDIAKIQGYVKEIEKKYGENKSVSLLCKYYFNVNDTFYSRISNNKEYKNEFQKFWLFIYEIAYELKHKDKEYDQDAYFIKYPALYTSICLNLNITGFIDDGCLGIIFPNEPCQGVLFKDLREVTGNLKIIPIYQKYDTAPNIDNSNNNKNNVSPAKFKERYEKYLAEKLKMNYVTIYSSDYSTLIKKGMPFVVHANNLYYFVNKQGNLTVSGVDTDSIFKNADNVEASDSFSSERTAYFNTLYGANYTSVDMFGRYGGNSAYAAENNTKGGVFINKENKPDISEIEPDEINDGYRRAEYFNQLLDHDKFERVGKFTDYGGEITVAKILSSGEQIFINRKGEADISGIDVTTITNSEVLTTLINQKLGKQVYKRINTFGRFGDGIALATQLNSRNVFININGEPTLENVDLNKIDSAETRAIYFNQKLGKVIFNRVETFNNRLGDGVLLGYYTNGARKFINLNGVPDLTNVLFDKIQDSSVRATYMNQKIGTSFRYVDEFGIYGEDIALATNIDGQREFIDKEGKSNLGNVDINLINDDKIRAVYVNKLLGTKYKTISSFNQYGEDVAYVTTNEKNFFINKQGKPDISNVNLDKIGDRHIRATYFNQKNGTNYAYVYDFDIYGKDVALATNNNSKYVFVNKAGVPDISNVKLSLIDNGGIRAAYFNQKTKKNYTDVQSFGRYGKGVALATDVNNKRTFINNKGQNSTATVDIDSIQDDINVRAIYFNQKYKTNYKTVNTFDVFGKDVAYATEYVNNKIKGVFINREGKPDISNVDINSIQNDNQRGDYINQKTGSKFSGVVSPREDSDIYFAQVPSGGYGGNAFNYIFITPEGQPITDNPSIEKLKTSYNISTVDGIVGNTKKYIAGEPMQNENILNLKSIVNEELINYFQK